MEYYRKFKENNLVVKFVLDDEAMLIALKSRAKIGAIIRIEISNDENLIAVYSKEFRNKVTPSLYDNFVEQLSSILGEDKANTISSQFKDTILLMSAMRWCARGLSVDNSIRKAKTDNEVAVNAKDTNTRRKYLKR